MHTKTPSESCRSANYKNTTRKLQKCKLQEHQAKVAAVQTAKNTKPKVTAVQTTRTPNESYCSANYKNTKRKLQQCNLQDHQAKVAAVQPTRTPSESCSSANYKNTKRKLQQCKQKHQATHQQLPTRPQHEPLVVPDTALGQVALVSTSGTVARAAEYNR